MKERNNDFTDPDIPLRTRVRAGITFLEEKLRDQRPRPEEGEEQRKMTPNTDPKKGLVVALRQSLTWLKRPETTAIYSPFIEGYLRDLDTLAKNQQGGNEKNG